MIDAKLGPSSPGKEQNKPAPVVSWFVDYDYFIPELRRNEINLSYAGSQEDWTLDSGDIEFSQVDKTSRLYLDPN